MTRFFLIVLLIIGGFFIVVWIVFKNIRNFLTSLSPKQNINTKRKNEESGQVIFKKDDIIVLKGEANKKEEK